MKPGYHIEDSCFYVPAGNLARLEHDFRPMEKRFHTEVNPHDPNFNLDMVHNARDFILHDWLRDICFVGEADRTNALALLLTFFLFQMISDPIPMFLVEASGPGSAKGLLCKLLTQIGTGRGPDVLAPGILRSPEESQRTIFAHLRSGERVFFLDNIEGIKSNVLASVLTADTIQDRVIRTSEVQRVSANAIWMATGNNPRFSRELSRRIVPIRLEPDRPRPWIPPEGGWHHPQIMSWMEEQRYALTHCVLILIEWWKFNYEPKKRDCLLGSYERWHEIVGGVLECCGLGEHLLANKKSFEDSSDEETEEWYSFFEAWWRVYRIAEVSTTQLLALLDTIEAFPEVHQARSERGRATVLGRRLQHARGLKIGKWQMDTRMSRGHARHSLIPLVDTAEEDDQELNEAELQLQFQHCPDGAQ